jgi:cell division septation protein DedD
MKRAKIVLTLGVLLLVALVAPTARAQTLGQITSPRDRAAVRGLVPIEGSATHPQFQKYEIHYGPEPNPGDQWTPIGGSPFTVPVVQGRLGLWDTTIIPDGLYSLRLRLVRLDGNYDDYFVRGIQVANTQPTDTPTPAETPTPAPPTETPSPTPTIVIGVPTVPSPTPRPTDTPLPTAPPTDTPEPVDLPFQNISDAACWGTQITLAVFVGLGLFFALKGWLAAFLRWLTRQGREGLGMYED